MFVFLLPYVCASLWGHVGEETEKLRNGSGTEQTGESADHRIRVAMDWGIWEIPMEEYLIYKLSDVIPEDYEAEALKAQAVLLRTELIQALKEEGYNNMLLTVDGADRWYETDADSDTYKRYRRAVEETNGVYLCYQGDAVQVSYFKVSNGKTRDAAEVWNTDKCPYLRSVSCVQDKAAQDYSSTVRVSKGDYLRKLQSRLQGDFSQEELWNGARLTYDSAEYVANVTFIHGESEEEKIDGETFRYLFELPSAAFEMEMEESQVIFRVKGVGHGFGMSQYGANCMALNGKTYDQILQEFFYRTELAKFE